jgi:hypothetical protein
MTGKYRFDPNADLTEKDLGHILRLFLDQHVFDVDDIESLPIEVRAHFTECLPDEFE